MNKLAKAIDTKLVVGLIAVLALIWAFSSGYISIPMEVQPIGPGAGPGGPGYATQIWFSTLNNYLATDGVGAVNYRIYDANNAQVQSETVVTTDPMTTSTMPNSLNGYVLIGNDNGLGTDRGAEIYYLRHDFNYVEDPAPNLGAFVYYNESTLTWRGYDNGVLESTLNLTMGAGATYRNAELEYEASVDAYVGNPQFRKLAVAFNCTNTTQSNKFEEIRPKTGWYTGTDTLPEFLSGRAFVGGLYILSGDSVVSDYGTYRFPIIIEAKSGQNPENGCNASTSPGDACYAHLLDWTYFINDNNNPASGWEDRSDLATDADIGMDAINPATQVKLIHFT